MLIRNYNVESFLISLLWLAAVLMSLSVSFLWRVRMRLRTGYGSVGEEEEENLFRE